MKEINENYYLKTKKRWLRVIKSQIVASYSDVIEKYGQEDGEKYINEIEVAFEKSLEELPVLDPNMSGIWTRQMVLTNVFYAVYVVLHKKYGFSLEDTWEHCMIMFSGFLKTLPTFVKKLALKGAFSKRTLKGYKRDDSQGKKKLTSEGDIINFYTNGEDYDYCTEITECAKIKFLRRKGALEFAPYVCLVDKLIAHSYKTGLVRTKTIADGYEVCDFKLTNNGVIEVHSPVWKDEWDKYLE